MDRTPKEIKKGLKCCCDFLGLICPLCQYAEDAQISDTCREEMANDALSIIQQLEARVKEVERERDQAIADLHEVTLKEGSCYACAHRPAEGECEYVGRCTAFFSDSDFWQWRGVKG